jgi:hypothetical protein
MGFCRGLVLVLCMVGWSCTPPVANQQKTINKYFDLDGLIDDQLKLIDSLSPSLSKTAEINGVSETTEFEAADSVWAKELLIFRLADLNKPTLVDSYQKRSSIVHGDSIITYISKSPKATLVDTLGIVLQNNRPKSVWASLNSANTLFQSSKNLSLHFEPIGDEMVVSAYSVYGWQKMTSRDSTTFFVQATINLP